MTDLVTTDLILSTMKEWVENKKPIAPTEWLTAAQKLNTLISDEHEKLFVLESEQANKYQQLIELHDTVAKARVYLEALPISRDVKRQKAKIEQIKEMGRISKKMATLSADELRGY